MKKIYLVLMTLVLSGAAIAQTVSIGTDLTQPGGSQYRSPWSPLYGFSYVQTIYLQSEINTSGLISSLRFNYSGTSLANSDVVTVWMGTVTRSEFASVTDWEPIANLTQVFQGQVTYTTLPGIVTINLTTPFNYSNTGNLVIAIDEDVEGFSEGTSFYASDMGGGPRTIYFNDDDPANNPAPATPPEADAIRNRVANIDIVFTSPTPVTLSEFSVEKAGNENKLNWSTQTEQNIKGFELQRSIDGLSFTSIQFIQSKSPSGNSDSRISYSFIDAKPLPGNNFYRLKQVDADGNISYSKVIMVKGSISSALLSIIYPNPVRNDLNLVLTSTGEDKVRIFITDLAGKVIFAKTQGLQIGNNKVHINPAAFAAGTYTIKAIYETSKQTAVGKFVKQ